MKSLIRLELRKQRKSFWGLLLIIAISSTFVTASISTFAELSAGEAFLLVTTVLQAFGLPFFALLLGCTAGATLKSSERKCEEDIPVRSSKRIFAAYITSLTYLLMLAGILCITTAPIKDSGILREDFVVSTVMALLLPLHSAAFLFSYWLSQALLGGVVSTIVTVPAYFFFPFWLFNAAAGLIGVGIQLSLMFWLANRIEREKRTWLPTKIVVGVILIFSIFLSVGVLIVGSRI